jgi:CBS domain containing-hemolysin-like protein
MVDFILSILFLSLAAVAVVVQKTYFYIPARELKRQAAHHQPLASVLWRAVGYGMALRILLWGLIALGAAVGLVLLDHLVPAIIAMAVVAVLLIYTFAWLPNTRLTSIGGRLTVWVTPVIVWLLEHSMTVLGWLQNWVRHHIISGHTGLYDREDLVELLETQKNQADNRITADDLAMAQSVLEFGTKVVRDVLTPRRVVKTIADDEAIGPVVMDDLHKSGYSRFPVHSGSHDNIVGVLYLRDLIRDKASGPARQHMHHQVCYVHEDQPLGEVLRAILKTHQQLFVVVNSFEEYVGIITMEDILEEVIGQQIVDEFDQYEDMRAVAARVAKKDHQTHEKEQSETEKHAESEIKTKNPQPKPDKSEDKKS